MNTVANIILRILLVVIIALAIVTGVLAYTYYSVDESAVPEIAVTLNGAELARQPNAWYTPVFGGNLYKEYLSETKINEFSLNIDYAEITVGAPEELAVNIELLTPSGEAVTAEGQTGTWRYVPQENGEYTYTIKVAEEYVKGEQYGEWVYAGSVNVNVKPEITISSTTALQGDILFVEVTGVGELPEPAMQQNIGFAQFVKVNNSYVAQIGVAHDTAPGNYAIAVQCGDLSLAETVVVSETAFGVQNMTITGSAASTMNTQAIDEYNNVVYSLFETADETIYWQGAFALPVDENIKNTEYGIYRYTNGSSTARRHVGIDYDGEIGDNVYASNNGRVVYADFLEVTGYTVVIEHGGGLKSYNYHLDSISCAVGDMVSTGDVIGALGTTGYSTGAHLHFEVRIGRNPVNPEPLIEGTSAIFALQ